MPVRPRPARAVFGVVEDASDRVALALHRADVERGLSMLAGECGAKTAELVEDSAFYPATPPGAFTVSAELLRHVAGDGPMLSRLVAVAGNETAVIELPIGTRVERALDFVGGAGAPVWVDGPLWGRLAQPGDSIAKTTGQLIAVDVPPRPDRAALRRAVDACLGCRRCTDLCPPAQLHAPIAPHKALRALLVEDLARLDEEAAWCTRCGVCFVSCPYGLDPRAAYAAPQSKWVATVELPPLRLPRSRVQARFFPPAAEYRPGPFPIHEVAVPCTSPRIRLGQKVRRGAPIAAGAHASIDGTVTAVLSDRVIIQS